MCLGVGLAEAVVADVCVSLSGCHIGVTQQLLHGSKIGAAIQQMCCEGMPQRVRVRGPGRATIHDSSHVARREPVAAFVAEQRHTRCLAHHFVADGQPGTNGIDCRHTQWNAPLLGAFTPHRHCAGCEVERVEVDGVDVSERWRALDEAGRVTRTETTFRALFEVAIGELMPGRGEISQLRVRAGGEVARMELRRAPAPCVYEGDPAATPVLVTGFQPFPANGWHDNVSEVAVRALRPERLRGVRVMRVILPVEYDRAAAAVADAIARCAPRAVVSFGQGGGAIALEETAYNLKDTGEVAGGVPDNRGVIAAALPIDPAAPAERATSLPLAAIDRALRALGEHPRRSDDPGRYICNNVFFTATGLSGRAGFVHLPYTTRFDDAERARWGRVAEAIVAAVADGS